VIESTAGDNSVSHVAVKNQDGSQVVVLTNTKSSAAKVRVVQQGRSVEVDVPADAVVTLAWS